ncbi:hydroxyacid dehydrogenase [Plantibacter sp. YIM 135347]|uniref:hydroxyacid dehydrogenase n=1 Tax=Plantibacter sp. YIM 135347 TaxID=3423919 RepID=UPI003D33DC51
MDTAPANHEPRRRPRAAFALRDGLIPHLFSEADLDRLDELLDILPGGPLRVIDPADERLRDIEVLITGWGSPELTPEALDGMPSLRAIFHSAGTVKGHVHPEAWERGIVVTSAADANAYPVAEYTLAMILLAGKGVPGIIADYTENPGIDLGRDYPGIGNYRKRVGILGASRVGRRVIELLAPFDFDLAVSDPFLADDDPILAHARRLELDALFAQNDIVSIHAPLLPSTVGLVDRRLLGLLPDGATLINTARAPIVDQDAVLDAAEAGRLTAILDVTDPEPLPADHPLRRTKNIVATPHVAGALGNELRRLGEYVLAEVEHYAAGEQPVRPVGINDLAAMA